MEKKTVLLEPSKHFLYIILKPIVIASSYPFDLYEKIKQFNIDYSSLYKSHTELQSEYLQLKIKYQKLKAVEIENNTLYKILDSAESIPNKTLMAKVVKISLNKLTRKGVINKGLTDNLYIGQPALDANGIIGYVSNIGAYTSSVTLINNPNQAIPIMIKRNGFKGIAYGSVDKDKLQIPYLSQNSDIQKGDEIISSGLGGRFPIGYKVGTVTKIEKDPSAPFLSIEVEPSSSLNNFVYMLLVWQNTENKRDELID